ncbi:hypothetical protein [Pseudomonas sp. H1h]|uniref:hypothetical protein n=1 Tax=Pseudomonas sp. H1h TaxID=1397280 RepID=UPI0004695299|nr:hypothetical protein [Pseudomonas sp. H1h]
MNTVEKIIRNEPVSEVISLFALMWPAMRIDNMYGRYRTEVISEGILMDTYNSLFKNGVLSIDANGKTVKGPNWIAPTFVTEKRYE